MVGSEGLLPLRGSPTSSEAGSRKGSPARPTHAALTLQTSGLSLSAAFVAGLLVMACIGLATGALQWSRGERRQRRRRAVARGGASALPRQPCNPHSGTLMLLVHIPLGPCSDPATPPHVGSGTGRQRSGSSGGSTPAATAAAPALAAASVGGRRAARPHVLWHRRAGAGGGCQAAGGPANQGLHPGRQRDKGAGRQGQGDCLSPPLLRIHSGSLPAQVGGQGGSGKCRGLL